MSEAPCRADVLGAADNYAALGTTVNEGITDSGTSKINGNVGVYQAGTFTGCGSAQDNGNIDFYDVVVAGSNYKTSGTFAVTGFVSQQQAAVSNAVADFYAACGVISNHSATAFTITSSTLGTVGGGEQYFKFTGNFNLSGNLTLQGSATDDIYITITGSFNQGAANSILLSGGITADHVFVVIAGTGASAFNSGGTGVLNGSYLVPHGGAVVSAITRKGVFWVMELGSTLRPGPQ